MTGSARPKDGASPGVGKTLAEPKKGGSSSIVPEIESGTSFRWSPASGPKDGGSPGVGKVAAKPTKGGSPGIVPEIESAGGGRGGRGRGGKGACRGRGSARSRGRGRGSGVTTAMESKGGVQHSHAMSDGTVRLSASPAAVFGAMVSTGQHSVKSVDIGGSVRMATPTGRSHLSASSSSSDRSSSSDSSSSAFHPPPKKHKPGEKAGPATEAQTLPARPPVPGSSGKGKVCAACLTKDDHNVEACPLLSACANGSEEDIQKAKLYCNKLSRHADKDVREWPNAHGVAWIPIKSEQIHRIRPDGHCLFAAMYSSRTLSSGKQLPADTSCVGPMARGHWVKTARRILVEEVAVRDASGRDAKAILLEGTQTAEEYLKLMSQSPPSPASWGGESELYMMAIIYECRICTLLFRQDPVEGSQVRLLTGPLGTTGHIHTLLFNGSHYDLVILEREQMISLGLCP